MKICLLCDEYPPAEKVGGIGSFVRDFSRELTRRGHEVTVVGVYRGITARRQERDGGVRVIRLPVRPGGGRFGLFSDRYRLGKEVRKLATGGLDVVEAPETGGWGLFCPGSVPSIVRLHSSTRAVKDPWSRGRMTTFLEDIAIRRAVSVLAVSRWVAAHARRSYPLAGLRGRTIRIVPNGIDTSLFRPRPWEERRADRVAFAGTIKPQKGVDSLLRALATVRERRPRAELVLAGADTKVEGNSFLERSLRESGLGDAAKTAVHWLGPVRRERLPELFGSASVCVFPSRAESFGLVAIEAMACARPVIYTRRAAGPEVIRHGVDGLLVDPENPDEIAGAMLNVLEDEPMARRLAEAGGLAATRRFSMEECARLSVDAYREVLPK